MDLLFLGFCWSWGFLCADPLEQSWNGNHWPLADIILKLELFFLLTFCPSQLFTIFFYYLTSLMGNYISVAFFFKTHTHILTHIPPHSLKDTHTFTDTHSLIHSHEFSHSRTCTLKISRILSYTHSHSNTHTDTHDPWRIWTLPKLKYEPHWPLKNLNPSCH